MRTVAALAIGMIAWLASGTASAVPIGNLNIDVFASSAPNRFGSPSWSGYAANALNSLENGLGTTGDRNLSPTAYEVLNGTYMPGDVMVTSFNSWRGVASPGAPFGSEYGNRLHFGLHIVGDGATQFKLNDLTFAIHSSDGDALAFVGDFVGFDFDGTNSDRLLGINWGADRVKGGVDDFTVTGVGSALLSIDELMYVGVGNAYWPGGPGDPLTGQAALDDTAGYILANNVVITGSYCITGSNGHSYCDGTSLTPVSEPGTLAVLGMGLLGLGVMRRRDTMARLFEKA